MWRTSGWLGREKIGIYVENSAKEVDLEDPTPLLSRAPRERQKFITHAVKATSSDLFRRFTTTIVTNEKQKNKTFQTITAWSYDMEGHAEECAAMCYELAGEGVSALKPAETPCQDDRQSSPEDFNRRSGTLVCADRDTILLETNSGLHTWINSERFSCQLQAGISAYWITNAFLDVQEANRRVSQQCRIRNNNIFRRPFKRACR